MARLQQASLLQSLDIQEQPDEQITLSITSTNNSNFSSSSGMTANAVINERLQTQCATQQDASNEKTKSIQG